MKQNIEFLKNWDGFVSPEGEFYKYQKWIEEKTPDDIFVEAFANDRLVIDSRRKLRNLGVRENIYSMSLDDVLVNILGYIAYRKDEDDSIEIMYPDYRRGKHSVTNEQLETLLAVVKSNENKNIHEKFYKVRQRKSV